MGLVNRGSDLKKIEQKGYSNNNLESKICLKCVQAVSGAKYLFKKKEFWEIKNFEYENKIYNVDLLKKLLPKASFNETVQRARQANQDNQFCAGSIKLYYSLFKHFYNNQFCQNVNEIRDFLEISFKESLLTTTGVAHKIYNDDFRDAVIMHNCDLDNQENILQKNFVKNNEYIRSSKDSGFYRNLLGSDDLQEIHDVFNWITGGDVMMQRRKLFYPCFNVVSLYSPTFRNTTLLFSCLDEADDERKSLGIRLNLVQNNKDE